MRQGRKCYRGCKKNTRLDANLTLCLNKQGSSRNDWLVFFGHLAPFPTELGKKLSYAWLWITYSTDGTVIAQQLGKRRSTSDGWRGGFPGFTIS